MLATTAASTVIFPLPSASMGIPRQGSAQPKSAQKKHNLVGRTVYAAESVLSPKIPILHHYGQSYIG
jgi:hypothetical protein